MLYPLIISMHMHVTMPTFAGFSAIPRPVRGLTEKALAVQEVIVSGTLVDIVTLPSGLE